MTLALEIRGAWKSFDGRPALRDATFRLAWGEVHALLGENGAGKSTLMTVACGLYRPDRGEMLVEGVPVALAGPADALARGITMVHQHFKLVRPLTVAENVLLACANALPQKTIAAAAAAIRATAGRLGLAVDPAARVGGLSVAEMQRVEILKALIAGGRILVLDEPTAVLTDREAEALLGTVRRLAAEGRAIVLISHKLQEVASVADRVTVMRAGETVADALPARGVAAQDLARLMVGDLPAPPTRPPGARGAARELFHLNDLVVRRPDGTLAVDGAQILVRGGEIYALAGVGGNGQGEMVEAIAGLRTPAAGQIVIDGRRIDDLAPRRRRALGLRIIPADRMGSALAADLDVGANLALADIGSGRFGPFAWVDRRAVARRAREAIQAFDIQGAVPRTRARLLSGGNAQKLVLARELGGAPRVVVVHSPTRGLDVKATLAVLGLLLEAARGGAAVLLVSEDLDEIERLADRIGVMSRGRIVGELPGDAPRAAIGELMIGHA